MNTLERKPQPGVEEGPVERIGEPVVVRVTEEHHVSLARQTARAMGEDVGVTPHYVATSVSELASNLFFHADSGGTITLAVIGRRGEVGLEVIAEDEGPGIPDVAAAMRDGFSTNGGLGGGLPGVQRLMDEFYIESACGAGTRIIARKWSSRTWGPRWPGIRGA